MSLLLIKTRLIVFYNGKNIKCQNMERKHCIFQPVFPNEVPHKNGKANIFLIYANCITDI